MLVCLAARILVGDWRTLPVAVNGFGFTVSGKFRFWHPRGPRSEDMNPGKSARDLPNRPRPNEKPTRDLGLIEETESAMQLQCRWSHKRFPCSASESLRIKPFRLGFSQRGVIIVSGHDPLRFLKRCRRLPTHDLFRPCRINEQNIDLGRTKIA